MHAKKFNALVVVNSLNVDTSLYFISILGYEEDEVWEDDDLTTGFCDDFVKEDTPPTDDSNCDGEIELKCNHFRDWLIVFIVHLKAVYHLTETAVESIIKFLYAFFSLLGRFNPICARVAEKFPASLYQLYKYHNVKKSFQKFVVCVKCHTIYQFEDCIEGHGINQRDKQCTHIEFINHPQSRMRQSCKYKLLKTVELVNGKKLFYPFMSYCYLGLEASLKNLFMRQGFSKSFESSLNTRPVVPHTMADVIHGKMWSDFQYYNDEPLLSDPYSLGLMMNFDFFQPYKHVTYSVGVIYLVIMNLPRNVRFKQENVLLIGILPGPREPSKDINSYLNPLVDELILFLEGIDVNIDGSDVTKKIKCVLLGISCDIPAGRKVCGFLSHNAHLGCSKCLKQFSGTAGNMDYSGFDREDWEVRTVAAHRAATTRIMNCHTKSARQKVESETGFRYTVLLKLPYFDSCRMLLVDPMHNLYLGSAKHVLKAIWIEKYILSYADFGLVQRRVDKCCVPSDMGRIPHKIVSGFSSFTADQFKNWVVYFSLIALRGILVNEHLECWRHFVLACRILSQTELSQDNIILADALLLRFCRRIEGLYGTSVVTPNMHLHCHLRSCIEDFGPLHGFWCFQYERYNGVLGQIPNNNKSIEEQLMNRFVNDNILISTPLPDMFGTELKHHLPERYKGAGSLLSTYGYENLGVVFPKCFTRCLFVPEEVEDLKVLYSKLNPDSHIELYSPFRKYTSVKINEKQLGSSRTRSATSSIVLIEFNSFLFNLSTPSTSTSTATTTTVITEQRPVRINYFAAHSIKVNGEDQPNILVCVSWFQKHPLKDSCGKPLTVWEHDIFETGFLTLVPVRYIKCRTISLVDTVGISDALIVCPCIDF